MPAAKVPDGMGRLLRALASAAKSLRLYPPSSPIPRQSVEVATAELERQLALEPVLAFAVARAGFTHRGESLGSGIAGVRELADGLRVHGVAEIEITSGVVADEVLSFLDLAAQDPEHVKSRGGLAALLASAGAAHISLREVQLNAVTDDGSAAEIADVDGFLRSLAIDPDRLSAWLATASAADPETFAEGLIELAHAAGDDRRLLLTAFAHAFQRQTADGKDAVLGLAMEPGRARELIGEMFGLLQDGEIAGSILAGVYGRNMLSLSSALTRLPLDGPKAAVRETVKALLPSAGKSAKEVAFLDHMLEIRASMSAEPALVDAVGAYRAVAAAGQIDGETVARACDAVVASRKTLRAAGVRTMLTLLDQHEDFDLYCRAADALASVVPRLVAEGSLETAAAVIAEFQRRQAMPTGPWPELTARLQASLARAVGPETMSALVRAAIDDKSALPVAELIVRQAGEAGASSLAAAAIAEKGPGIEVAEGLLGRRLVDQLAAAAPQTQWHRLGPVVARLARENDQRSASAIQTLLQRPDAQSRREVAVALGGVDSRAAAGYLAIALRDADLEVSTAAARALGSGHVPDASAVLAERLGEIDIDGSGYPLAREAIAALARLDDLTSEQTLNQLAARRQLLKRGHHAEVQGLVQEAIARRRARSVTP